MTDLKNVVDETGKTISEIARQIRHVRMSSHYGKDILVTPETMEIWARELEIINMRLQSEAGQCVLTYENKPDNIGAWRLGEACTKAAADPKCGDYIDRGLILLRDLQAKGYGVVALPTQPRKRDE